MYLHLCSALYCKLQTVKHVNVNVYRPSLGVERGTLMATSDRYICTYACLCLWVDGHIKEEASFGVKSLRVLIFQMAECTDVWLCCLAGHCDWLSLHHHNHTIPIVMSSNKFDLFFFAREHIEVLTRYLLWIA